MTTACHSASLRHLLRRSSTGAAGYLAVAVMVSMGIAQGQIGPVEARAASVSGHVMLASGANAPFALSRGHIVSPGDRMDTRGGGKAVIELSDGSVIVVAPETVLVFKDYLSATSLRELFEITVGRVQVKINHLAGKPNPYRVNSPTASIAVRGTEFSVAVDGRGETEVVVYEGRVEVASLSDPSHTTLIEAGRGVVVQPGQEFWFFTPGQARDTGQRNDGPPRDHAPGGTRAEDHPPAAPADHNGSAPPDHEERSPRIAAGTYERYIASLSEVGLLPFQLRFNAFAESHLDSLENPANAGIFREAEGRLLILPAFNGSDEPAQSLTGPGTSTSQHMDFSIAPQFSYFAPIGKSGFVAGGSFSAARSSAGIEQTSPQFDPGVLGHGPMPTALQASGTSTSSFLSGSAIVAKRFGAEGENRLGFSVERLKGWGGLLSVAQMPEPSGKTSTEQIDSHSDINQTRFTAGWQRDFSHSRTLGVFYRYGLIEASDADTSHILNNLNLGLDSTRTTGHSSEVGVRLRGQWGPRLAWGAYGSLLNLELTDGMQRDNLANSHQYDHAHRESLGVGIGYLAGTKTVLSFDIAGGASQVDVRRTDDGTGLLAQTGFSDGRFVSFHGAIQRNLTDRLFLSATLLVVKQSHESGYVAYPDQNGARVPLSDSYFPLSPSAYALAGRYSDFGAGWRFSPQFLAQYTYSTDYGYSSSSHTLLLRYTFKPQHE